MNMSFAARASGKLKGTEQRDNMQTRGRLNSVFFSSSPAPTSTWKQSFMVDPIGYFRASQEQRALNRRNSSVSGQLSQLTRALDAPESSLYGSSSPQRKRKISRVFPFQTLFQASSEFTILDATKTMTNGRESSGARARAIAGGITLVFFVFSLFAVLVSLVVLCFPTSVSEEAAGLLLASKVTDGVFGCKAYASLFHRRLSSKDRSTPVTYALEPRCRKANFFQKTLLLDLLLTAPLMTFGLLGQNQRLVVCGAIIRLLAFISVVQAESAIYSTIDLAFGAHRGIARRVVRILLRLLALCFLLCVIFYAASFKAIQMEEEELREVQIADRSRTRPFTFSEFYVSTDLLTAFYFILQTLLTVGYGDVLPDPKNPHQLQFVLLCICFAIGVHALLLAHMTALLKNLNVTTTHFKHQMEMITRYLRARQITPEVRLKIANYFEFLWDRQRGRLESQILNPLPADLRDKISQGRRSALLNIPVFQNRDMAFLDAIATSLEPQIISLGDFLCLRNTPVDAMWILGEGLLEVLSAGRGDGVSSRHGAMRTQQSRKQSGFRLPWSKGQGQPEHKAANRGESHSSAQAKVVETIRPGVKGYYGEEILFSTRFRHKFSVRAAQVCEVQCLDVETFLFVLEIFGAHRHEDLFDDQSQVSTPVSGHETEVSEVASSIGSRMSLLSGLTKPRTKAKGASAGTGAGEPDGKDNMQMSLQQARFGRGERRNRSSMVSAEVIQDIIAPPILRDRSGGNLNSIPMLRSPGPSTSTLIPSEQSATASRPKSFLSRRLASFATTRLLRAGASPAENLGQRAIRSRSRSIRQNSLFRPAATTNKLVLPPIPHHVDLAGPSEAGKVEVLVQDSNVVRTVREWKERDAKRLENAKKKVMPKRAFTLRSLSMAVGSVDRCQALFSLVRFLADSLSATWSAVRRNYWSQIGWNAAVIVAHLALCILPPLDLVLLARGSSNALPWHVYAMSDVIVFVNVVCVPHFQAKSSAGGSPAGVANKDHAEGNDSTLVKSSSTNPRTSELKLAQGTLAHRGRGQILLYGTLGVIALCAYGVRASREFFMHIWAPLRLTSIVLFWPLLFEEIQRLGHRFEWFRRRSALQIVALNVAFAIAVTVHWSSCIASCLSSRGDWVVPEAYSLLYDNPDLRGNELTYWHAFYWTVITMTTVGYGDITPRDDLSRLVSLIVMISGVLLYAGFISIVAAITRNASGVDHELEQFEDCCKHYLAQREVPRKLTSDCCLYLEYLGAHQQRLQELTMLANIFPQSLEDCIREDILSKTFFGSGSIFADAPRSFVRCLQRRMHKDVFLPEHIITCGFDPASGRKRNDPEDRGITDAMIFLEEGQANIVGFVEDGKVQKNMGLLGSGRVFAAVALFDPSLQHHMLRAKTTCEVWFLSRRELDLCVKEHECSAPDLADAAYGASGASTPKTAASQELDPDTPTSSRSSRDDLRHFVYETLRERAEKATHNAENVAKNLGNAKLNKLMMSTRNVTETTSDWGVCLPEGREQAMWSVVMAIVTAYNILTASYRIGIGFGTVGEQLVTMSVLDGVADICLLCNVGLRDRIFAIEVDGVAITRRGAISKAYRMTDARRDLVYSLPLSLVARLIDPGLAVQVYAGLRLNTCLMTYRMQTWLSTIASKFGSRHHSVATLILLFVVVLVCAHVSGSLFLGVARWNIAQGSEVSWATSSEEVSLLTIHNLTGTESVVPTNDTYIRSVYWAVATLTTVGYGDYAPVKDSEIAYTLLLFLCGGFLYALILNNLEEIIAQSDNCSILFQRKVDAMATYMKRRTLPSSVVHQVTSYYKTLWIRQKGVEESWIQDRLPLTIRRSMRADLIGPRALQAFPLFAQWDETEKLLDLLRPSMVMEDAIIFMEGQLILKCYFVGRGQVEYVSGDAKQVCTTFSSGDSFGEIQFFFNEPTECIARAKERTDLLVLHRLDFDNFVQERPSLATRFSQDLSAIEGDLRKRASLEAFTRNLGRSKVNKLFRVDTDSVTKPRWLLWNGEKLLPPHNIYRRLWDLLVFAVVLYNIVGGTYRMAFLRDSIIGSRAASGAMSFLGLDVLADFIIVLDAIFHATLFAAVTPTSILWDRTNVRAHFFRRQLIMYIAILSPMDYALRLGAFRSRVTQDFGAAFLMNPPPHVIAMGRASRLLLLPRQPSLERSAQSLVEECGVVISSGNKQILRLAFRAIILVHLMACVKCALSSRFLELMGSENRALDAYMLCLYWAVYTISTVGYGDIPVDAPTFAIVCIILGNFLCDAGLTATVSNILSNRESKLSDAKRHRTALVQYMKSHRIDTETRLEVLDFVDFRVSALGSLDESSLLDEANVPSYVRAQIAACIALQSAPHLGAHPMFKGFSLGLVQSMALMLSPVVLARGHKLISKDSSKPGMAYTSGKARRPSRPKNEDSEDGNDEGKASGKIPRGGLKYVSSRTYGLSPPAESGGGSSVAYRKVDEMPELASLDFLRQAKLTDPSKSLHLASHANVGWRRYPANADDDNLYFLVSGRVRVTSGLESKTIRRGLICRASGIDGAVALSHCEAFVLEVAQFRVLAQYSAHIGNGIFKDFIELLRDRDGYAAVEQFLTVRKNGDYISDIRFWRACEIYEASPTRSAAVAIGREFVYGPECLLDFGPLARQIKETLAEGHSRDLFSQAKRDIYHRLELVVKPRFLASAEFADLLIKKANSKTSSRSQPTMDDGDLSAETIHSVPEGSAVTERVASIVADNVQRARSSSALDVALDDVDERKDEVVPLADDVEVDMNEAADDEEVTQSARPLPSNSRPTRAPSFLVSLPTMPRTQTEHANLDAATPSIHLGHRFAQEEKDHLDPIVSPDSEPSDDEVDALQPVVPEFDRFATEEDDLA